MHNFVIGPPVLRRQILEQEHADKLLKQVVAMYGIANSVRLRREFLLKAADADLFHAYVFFISSLPHTERFNNSLGITTGPHHPGKRLGKIIKHILSRQGDGHFQFTVFPLFHTVREPRFKALCELNGPVGF